MITGGCFCGAVRYELAQADYLTANCHCTMCRRTSAAPFVTWLVAPATAFRYTRGEPKVLHSSAKGTRYFCADCGTPLACDVHDRDNEIDVTTGSLDNPNAFAPALAVHEDTKLTWLGHTEASAS